MTFPSKNHWSPDPWEDIRDICGWMFGGMFALIGLLLILAGRPPLFAPMILGLGVSILPPVVDVTRMVVPYWRWTFVPTGAFLLGVIVLVGTIVVQSGPQA